MKKLIFILIFAAVFFIACDKETSLEPSTPPIDSGITIHPPPTISGDTLWYNPAIDHRFTISGRGWDREDFVNPYGRLPETARHAVRPEVWILAHKPAGVSIDFMTDASSITVRYQVGGALSMNHMPVTGVSGVDLYADDQVSEPVWCRPRYSFGDTIVYRYTNLQNTPDFENGHKRFRLHMPLYNSVTWMEIGLIGDTVLNDSYVPVNKPIVVYGTSITQGACASRPGLAWTSVLQRATRLPVVNLGFSDNGRMETDVVDFMEEIDASIYVIDCLPNMINETSFPDNVLEQRIRSVYQQLRAAHSDVPILFTQHLGLSDEVYNLATKAVIDRVNNKLAAVISTLQQEGADHLYILSKAEVGMCQECTVDGTHPTDDGMMYIADAYQEKIRLIFEDMDLDPEF